MEPTNSTQGSQPGSQLPLAPPPPSSLRAPRRRRSAIVTGAIAAAAVIGTAAVFGVTQGSSIAGTATAAAQVNTDAAAALPQWPGGSSGTTPGGGTSGQSGSGQSGTGLDPYGQLNPYSGGQLNPYSGGQLGGGTGGSTTSTLATATADQQTGVVMIDTELAYQGAEAAGTGMVLTADGDILTNNHVIAGATSITVTIVSSGESYPATVIGSDATDDVAVLQLSGAENLTTANFSDSTNLAVGDAVTGVGNAGGVGGIPSASPGTVTALNQTITTQDEAGAAGETLHGLIETDADIEAGDSGGPLFDANNQVVGIDTAAQVGGYTTAGYAIPIASALSIAQQIQNGQASENIVIGYPAFLGVQVSETSGSTSRYSRVTQSGALISGVVEGTPAAEAGLTAGDTITAVDGTTISTPDQLTTALAQYSPGENVTITWVGSTGASESATVTLATGPAL